MANHMSSVPNWLTAEYMQTAMRISLNNPDFIVENIQIEPGSKVGDNYMCQVFRIDLFLGNGEGTLSVIAKLKPQTKTVDEVDSEFDVFESEADFFAELLPRLNEIEKQYTPKPYCVDYKNKLIIMEDLKSKGYVMEPRRSLLDVEEAVLAVEAIAVLHGTSFYVLEDDPRLKKKYDPSLWNDPPNEAMLKFLKNGLDAIEKWLPTYGLTDEQNNKVSGLKGFMWSNFSKVCEKREDHLLVLCHGDCWKNNIMFHKTNDVADKASLIDFQSISFNSFANDLHYFIFSSVQAKLILTHLDWILHCYYNKLKEIAPHIPDLTFARVKAEFDEKFVIGIVITFIMRAMVVSEIPMDMDDMLGGKSQDEVYRGEKYISDLKILIPFFEDKECF